MPELTPEEKAREQIDSASGWVVQGKGQINLSAARGVAICELSFGTGESGYTLFVDGEAIATVEANLQRTTRLRQSVLCWMRRPSDWIFRDGRLKDTTLTASLSQISTPSTTSPSPSFTWRRGPPF